MNKKSVYYAISIVLIGFMFSSCLSELFGKTGTGEIIIEERTVANFRTIELLSSADVEIVKGDSFKIEVSDYENIIEYLSLKVVAGNLLVSTSPISTILINSKARVMITMPDTLSSVTIAGSGDITLKSTFKNLEYFIITGSGSIKATEVLNLKKLNASILGSGNMEALGEVEKLTCLITGSGNMYFSSLKSVDAKCTISGSGNMSVFASQSMDALISGSGNIECYGNPPTFKESTPGSGSVIKK